MLYVTETEKKIISRIIIEIIPTRVVAVFGSRANGNPKPYSDIDLAIYGDTPLPISVLAELRHAFSASDLPYRVDIVDMSIVSKDFRSVIEANNIIIIDK
ncbi:MAG: nucleotidyltransferase domain-containing protein [Patescibacteria group bacterium]